MPSGKLSYVQKPQLSKVLLTSSEEIAEDVYLISFKRNFEFLPGQVIGISPEENGPKRLYSICSGVDEDEIRILYNVVEEGYVTPRLSDLNEGDAIWITAPRGKFLYDEGPAYWISTGTGIAPFYSMYRSGLFENKRFIHGERFLERFWFYDELYENFGENYLRCCSRESDETTFNGRVTDYLRTVDHLPADYKYYLCGRAEMVVEARDILIGRGIPFNNIISEIYF